MESCLSQGLVLSLEVACLFGMKNQLRPVKPSAWNMIKKPLHVCHFRNRDRHSLHTSPKELLERFLSLFPNVDEFLMLVNEFSFVFLSFLDVIITKSQ